jgi:hypothetical protein
MLKLKLNIFFSGMNFSTLGENATTNWSTPTPEYTNASLDIPFVQIDLTVALVFSILDLVGIMLATLANVFLIGLVLSHSDLRKTTDVFTSSLCVSDLLASVLFQPFVIRRLLAREPNQPYEWAVRRTIGQATLSASSMSLLTATIDRYIVLRWPLRYENIISKRTALFVVSGIWLASFAMGATAYFKRNLSAVVFPSILGVIVVSIVATQISIFIIARKQVKKIWKHSRSNDKGKKLLSNMRATKTIALLLTVFLLSWLPSTIFRFYERLSGGDNTTFHTWLHPLNTLIQIHCSLDPFLYVLRNQRFKKAIAKVVKRCC